MVVLNSTLVAEALVMLNLALIIETLVVLNSTLVAELRLIQLVESLSLIFI